MRIQSQYLLFKRVKERTSATLWIARRHLFWFAEPQFASFAHLGHYYQHSLQ